MGAKHIYPRPMCDDKMFVTVEANHKAEADRYIFEKYNGTLYDVLGCNKRYSFRPCHHVYAERVGIREKVIKRRYCYETFVK